MAWTLSQWWEAYISPLTLLWLFTFAILRTWFRALLTLDVAHLTQPRRLLSRSFGEEFEQLRSGFREGDAEHGVPAIVRQAHGIVVELGAGVGNQADRFDARRIQHIYAIEPNRAMIPALRAAAAAVPNLRGKYTIVPYGAQDQKQLRAAGITPGSVDCVLCVQVLCSVPEPQRVLAHMYDLLKPGGELIVLEHIQCTNWMNRAVQYLYNPFWKTALDGCSLTRPTDALLVRAGKWDRVELDWDNKTKEMSLFPRVSGRLIKAKKA